jgi:hypothetical protein
MLLYDHLAHRRFFTVSPATGKFKLVEAPELGMHYCETVKKCVPFEITNVSEFMYTGTNKEKWDKEDFPRPLPPFEHVWFEWKCPKVSISKERGVVQFSPGLDRIGAVVMSSRKANDRLSVWFLPCVLHRGGYVLLLPLFGYTVDLKTFEILDAAVNAEADSEHIHYTSEGKGYVQFIFAFSTENGTVSEDLRQAAWSMGRESHSTTMPCQLALSFLNCRNTEVRVVKTPGRLAHSHKKKGKTAPTDYHVIEIQPIKTKLEVETGKLGYSKQAAAIIRGHFKNYQEGHGLFGKIHGLYWWDQRVTGNLNGKHYELARAGGTLDNGWEAVRR